MNNDPAEHIIVPPEDDGQRLDRWLKKHMPFVLAQKLIRKGAIRVDGKKAKQDTRIQSGQSVRIPPFDKPQDNTPKPKPLTDKDRAYIRDLVIFDDGDIVVIDKPEGLASQGGGDLKQHVDRLLDGLADKNGLSPKLIHRLDMDTSGVMITARKPDTIRKLGQMFKTKKVRKTYWALTLSCPEDSDGLIRAPIGKIKGPIKDKMQIDEDDGKHAVTEFVVLEQAHKQAAFIAFSPHTGRTHQIRLHSSAVLECPIIGDKKYGGESDLVETMGLADRLHLHAYRLTLPHPTKHSETLDFIAPLPKSLEQSWQILGFDPHVKIDPFEDA